MGVYHPDHPRWKGKPSTGQFDAFPEWVSRKGFKVTEQIDTKPGHQGTFPSVNWNLHKVRGYGSDANHPDWEEVQHQSPMSTVRQAHEDKLWDGMKDDATRNWPPRMETARPEVPGQTELPLGKQWQG